MEKLLFNRKDIDTLDEILELLSRKNILSVYDLASRNIIGRKEDGNRKSISELNADFEYYAQIMDAYCAEMKKPSPIDKYYSLCKNEFTLQFLKSGGFRNLYAITSEKGREKPEIADVVPKERRQWYIHPLLIAVISFVLGFVIGQIV